MVARAHPKRKRQIGRGISLTICVLFAIVGALPLASALLVRLPMARAWAARETQTLVERELGVAARYQVRIRPWPLSLAIEDIEVASNDPSTPFARIEEVSIRPRLFSLLAGKLDVGDIEVTGARATIIVRDGGLANLPLKLPKSEGEGSPDAPFSSATLTDTQIDLDLEGTRVALRELDVDVNVVSGGTFDISLRAGSGSVVRARAMAGRDGEQSLDEDRVCRLEGKLSIKDTMLEIRRFVAEGVIDFDPDEHTLSETCALDENDWRALSLHVSGVRVELDGGLPSQADGHVSARVPVAIAHRFVKLPHTTGRVGIDLDLSWRSGLVLPVAKGQISFADLGLDGKVFGKRFSGNLDVRDDQVHLDDAVAEWADGHFTFPRIKLSPFAPGLPLEATSIAATNVELRGILRDLGVHPQSYAGWTLSDVRISRFTGTLDPLKLEGDVRVDSRDFGIYDRPSSRSDRRRMISHAGGTVEGRIAVKPEAFWLENMHVVTARSNLTATVKLGYSSEFGLSVRKGSVVDLSEVSPLSTVAIGGRATVEARGGGTFDVPTIDGDLSVEGFSLGGIAAGNIEHAKAKFVPLVLELSQAELVKNKSRIRSDHVRVDFDKGADVLVDADVDTTTPEGLKLRDFFEVFGFEKDPRFADISGIARGLGRVHYAIGGPEDRCGGGALAVRLESAVERPSLFGETYDSGAVDVNFVWNDKAASGEGMSIDVYSASLREGAGSIVAQAEVRPGGVLRGNLVASGFPLGSIDALGGSGKIVEGDVSAVGRIQGTLGRPEADIDVSIGPVRIGTESLPASRIRVLMEPNPAAPRVLAKSHCQNPIGPAFDLASYQLDLEDGRFLVNGALLGGQIRIEDLSITRQRQQRVKGRVSLSNLDLGKFVAAIPSATLGGTRPSGRVSAQLDIAELRPDKLAATDATLTLFDLELSRGRTKLALDEATAPIRLSRELLELPTVDLVLSDPSGLHVELEGSGNIDGLFSRPSVDARLALKPIDLSKLKDEIPALSRIAGRLAGNVSVKGPLSSPRFAGDATLRQGAFTFASFPTGLDDVEVDVAVRDGEVRLVRASAKAGSGTIDVTGRAPIVGFGLGSMTANITARNLRVPLGEGMDLVSNANLEANYRPNPRVPAWENLPMIRGDVSIVSFSYTRPITLNLDLAALTKNLKRSTVQSYDPINDVLGFDIQVTADKALRVQNDLLDMKLEVATPGIKISGTNQRFGAKGSLKISPDSKMRPLGREFAVREGVVRFDNPTDIRPSVDVRASHEFQRYASSGADSSSVDTSGAATSGRWVIGLRAHGPVDGLKVDLTSDPPLDQDDIVLLLTVGMTRAEADRSLASSLTESIGLEALSALTGADKAVRSVVPIIDYFHFGSSYSSRTGRTEPSVTVGKRLTDDVRASVSTTLTEREVGATLEWQFKKGVSLQASYDNTNDVNATLGNLGADLRWRLEFE